MKKILLLSAMLVFQANATPTQYEIDPGHFFIQFKVPHLGFSHVLGTFNDVKGTYTFDNETGEISDVNIIVNVNSLDTDHGERNKHLRGDKFLNTDKYAEATFKSTGWKEGQLTGDLTLLGKTHSISIPVEKVGEGGDPWGKYRTGFETHFKVDFTDYGIPDNVAKFAEIYVTGEGVKK